MQSRVKVFRHQNHGCNNDWDYGISYEGHAHRCSKLTETHESTINEDEAALMAAIDRIKDIKEAYPSCFLDTKVFPEHLDDFDKKGQLL